MKILVIPDVHQTTAWQKLLKNTKLLSKYDKVIQLGDWFDNWKPNWKDNAPIRNFNLAVDISKNNPKFDVLLGNHDFSYISEQHCSGYQANFAKEIYKAIFEAAPYVNVAKEYDGWVFSHAGISCSWMNMHNLTSVDQINDVFHNVTIPFYKASKDFKNTKTKCVNLTTAIRNWLTKDERISKGWTYSERENVIYDFAINEAKRVFNTDDIEKIKRAMSHAHSFEFNGVDCYGDDTWQTPIWIRPNSLLSNMYFDKQVVGHTEYEKVVDITENGNRLVVVDSPNHDFYVELDTETNEVKKIEEVK